LNGAEDSEDDCAYRHKVEMRDEKIAVLSLPIERYHGMTYPGDSGEEKLDKKGDAE
jgi:hypothetical protein